MACQIHWAPASQIAAAQAIHLAPNGLTCGFESVQDSCCGNTWQGAELWQAASCQPSIERLDGTDMSPRAVLVCRQGVLPCGVGQAPLLSAAPGLEGCDDPKGISKGP